MIESAKPVPPPAPQPPAPPLAAATGHWKPKLRWFLAEFVVVVAGILVALAVSSWAQDRQEQQRERVYLQQLSADLRSSEQLLAEAVDVMRKRAQASARVLHRFWRKQPTVDESFVEDLALPRTSQRFRPVLGTVEALTSSGDLGLIRSATLRAGLLTYVESTKTTLEDISRYDETYYRPGMLMLYRGPDLFAFARFRTRDDRMLPRPNGFDRVPFPSDLAGMLRDRDVYVGYSLVLVAHRNQANGYEKMLEQTRALRKQVEAAIDR